MTETKSGCPKRRDAFSRDCKDVRCLANWTPEGAPSLDEQLHRWVLGDAVCPNVEHTCCPDFACCNPKLAWDTEKRQKFVAADPGTREKMMMGALGALVASLGVKAHVTRGDPTDHE